MIQQVAFKLKPQSRGFHLITDEVLRNLPQLPKKGLLNLFVQHTSCALSICELTEQRAQSQACLSFAESQRKKAKPTDGAASAKPSLLELCRVATEEGEAN